MQDLVTNWEGLLRATSGALVPDKCFWYLINQWWEKDHWWYINTHEAPVHLQVADATGQLTQIPQLEPSKAHQTLGVCITPGRNLQIEFDYFYSVTKDWQAKMSKAKLTHNDAQFSLQCTILQKLVYPLAVTTFTAKQCYCIMQPKTG